MSIYKRKDPIKVFITAFPNDELVIVKEPVWTGKGFSHYTLYSATRTGLPIQFFSRDRDAWRALRKFGYVREGKVWRKAPKADSEVSATVAALTEPLDLL